jgi:hypothetical protein
MLESYARRLLFTVIALVSIPLVAWSLTGAPLRNMGTTLRDANERPRDRAEQRREPPAEVSNPVEWAGRAVGVAWYATRPALVLAAGAVLVLVGLRLAARRRRRMQRLWLLPHRADEATPAAIETLYKAWHEQLCARWWQRLAFGQPSLTLELHSVGEGGARQPRLIVGCPQAMGHALSGPLHACWPNARLIPHRQAHNGWDLRMVMRLRKRYAFVLRLATPQRGDEPTAIDALLSTAAELDERVIVQLALTPTPASFDHVARGMLREREQTLQRAADRGGSPGIRGQAAELELQGARATQWKPLFFCDIRIAADSRAACGAVAGALQAASAENRLRAHECVARRGLYLRRMAAGLGQPLPGVRKGVVSTAELVGLFALPSPAQGPALQRSSVPRLIAPPQVQRPSGPLGALGRDDKGYVGLHGSDLSRNLALIGQIGAGKTSVLARTTERDAHDRDCCVIVIDPNSTGVAAHLSAVPEDRVVHFLDVAAPECGFNPLLARGPISKVADDLVEAFIDTHEDGEIMTSSRQFLGGSSEAVIGAWRKRALELPPSFWDMWRVLTPEERAFREKLLDAIGSDPELLGAATLLGQDIPQGLRDIGSQYALRMSAPRNKLFVLRSSNVDRVLRHPVQLNLAEIIARREVLIVDGRMGSTGVHQTRLLVMFLLNLLFAELRLQLERPEAERVRVCLKLDEAHLVMSEHFATALATLRAAGLETTACYQYSAQLKDQVVRAGAASLLASRCIFQLSEIADAEENSKLCMEAYSSSVRDDPVARARMAVTPDALIHLPRHWAICSWQAHNGRVPAFSMNTLPLAESPARIAHHRAAQHARGYHVADVLPHAFEPDESELGHEEPLGGLDEAERRARREALGELDDDTVDRLMRDNGTPQPREPDAAVAALTETKVDKGNRATPTTAPKPAPSPARKRDARGDGASPTPAQVQPAPSAPAAPQDSLVPESYMELQIEPSTLSWDDAPIDPIDRAPAPDERTLEILSTLHRLGPLLTSQLQRRFFDGVTDRSVQRALATMRQAGWVRRFRLREAHGRGQPKYVYVLARRGFELAKGRPGPHGAYIAPDVRFVEHRYDSVARPLHDLHANGLLLALLDQMPTTIKGWKGPGEGVLHPPRRRPRGSAAPRPLRPDDIPLPAPMRLSGLSLNVFETVKPDLTLELALPDTRPVRRVDVLVELDRTSNPRAESNVRKLARYDALLTAWYLVLRRYRTLGGGPVAIVACEDEPAARRWAAVADELLTGRLSRMGDPESETRFSARRRMFFATELDLHRGTLRGYRVAAQPPDLRRRQQPSGATSPDPELVTFLPARFVR